MKVFFHNETALGASATATGSVARLHNRVRHLPGRRGEKPDVATLDINNRCAAASIGARGLRLL
jgi:hypothetical protein